MKYAVLRAENERLRSALEEVLVFEMIVPEYENGRDVSLSEGWVCAHCDLGDGCANREYADEKNTLTHVPSCPLYRATQRQSEEGTKR